MLTSTELPADASAEVDCSISDDCVGRTEPKVDVEEAACCEASASELLLEVTTVPELCGWDDKTDDRGIEANAPFLLIVVPAREAVAELIR